MFPSAFRRVGGLGKVNDCATNTVDSFICRRRGPTMSNGIFHIIAELLRSDSSVVGTDAEAGVRHVLRRIVPTRTPKSFGRKLVRLKTVIYLPGKRPGYRDYPVERFYLTCRSRYRVSCPIGGGTGRQEVRGEAVLEFYSGRRVTVHGEPKGKLLTKLCRFPGMRKRLARGRIVRCTGRSNLAPIHIGGLPGTGRVFDRIR